MRAGRIDPEQRSRLATAGHNNMRPAKVRQGGRTDSPGRFGGRFGERACACLRFTPPKRAVVSLKRSSTTKL
jgi:hypothetical protein